MVTIGYFSPYFGNTVLHTFATFAEAEKYAFDNMRVAHYEVDHDHVDCADFLGIDGIVYNIQPEA